MLMSEGLEVKIVRVFCLEANWPGVCVCVCVCVYAQIVPKAIVGNKWVTSKRTMLICW